MKTQEHAFENKKRRLEGSRFILQGTVIALLSLMAVQGCGYASHPLEGKQAPSFALPLVDGGAFDLASHLGKRPVVLEFWAVWCPACRANISGTATLVNQFKDRDVVICTVNLGDNRDAIVSFLKSKSVAAPVAMDERSALSGLYQLAGIPTKVFIDREGKISRVVVGSMTTTALSETIEKML